MGTKRKMMFDISNFKPVTKDSERNLTGGFLLLYNLIQ